MITSFTHFFTVGGAAGTQNPITMPRDGILRGIDIAAGYTFAEAAPAYLYAHAIWFRGAAPDITSPTNDTEYENAIGGIAQIARSNATFGIQGEQNKFIPLNIKIKRLETWQLAYRVSAGGILYTFSTFVLEV